MAGPAQTDTVLTLPVDDAVIIFRTARSSVHGRIVRLGPVADKILKAHALPHVASNALGEVLVLAALLGSALPGSGNIAVQTRTNGLVSVLYADCEAPGRLRGYARCDAGTLAALKASGEPVDPARIFGEGHLAFTIDQGAASERYQGVIALDGGTLAATSAQYFEQRENLPTFMRLAIAQHYAGANSGLSAAMNWRGGGLMIQNPMPLEDESGDDPWSRVRMLTATVEDHELLDPALSAERLLLRLFHEEGVIIDRVLPLSTYCKCARERIASVLQSFGSDDISDMRDEHGKIAVTCEFCAATYAFELQEIVMPPDAAS
ncbi:MAG: Hsp33 family molecular chaperone HslO [Hyphomicrobium sp.]